MSTSKTLAPAGEKDSFWYIFAYNEDKDIYENIHYGYVFFSNGNLDYKGFDFSTNILRSFKMDDVEQVMTWNSQQKNNVIKIENKTYNIISSKNDTLRLQYANSKKKRVLINLKNKNPTVLKSFKL
ncbi:MAG: hypothetical protein LBE92_07315 [Chryseobacterium sp.]|jgi:hypothetical protein|uniref:hypothetical protein n=1 Tax=Chryseobacterium sp. TaxID=1871047 RepID=UPI002836A58A|nr:hypothetical protein [Chryseobacterium sp.]MDR2235916.1 hypothetical protein [Chryseobacterium sp.]